MYSPKHWGIAFPYIFATFLAAAVGLPLAWNTGNVFGVGLCGGLIAGLMISIAWALRRYTPGVCAVLFVCAVALLLVLWEMAFRACMTGAVTAAMLLIAWICIYDIGYSRRMHAETVSPVTNFGGDGSVGRAFIVYHATRGGFQSALQTALAEVLVSRGWSVDITTASRETPKDLSGYDLLVIGSPSYNWIPARPVVSFVRRVRNFNGKPVLIVVSGGGYTERTACVLRRRVERAHGTVLDAMELWTRHPNVERYGTTDPIEIIRRAGSALSLVNRD